MCLIPSIMAAQWSKLTWFYCLLVQFILLNSTVEAISAQKSPEKVILQSPRVTSFGVWGEWDDCPKGTFVRGLQIKTQPDKGSLGDDSAMNGVKLCCSHPGYTNCVSWIKSSEGPFGHWGDTFYCKGLVAAKGFVLRQDDFQKSTNPNQKVDETASNNMRLICSDDSVIEGDGLSGGYWDWEEPKECPKNQFICGVRTQIVPPQGLRGDNRGLNNVDLKCCARCNAQGVCVF